MPSWWLVLRTKRSARHTILEAAPWNPAAFFLLAVLVATTAIAQRGPVNISVGPNYMVSSIDQDRVHDEVQIAVKPGDSSTLTACSMASGTGPENQTVVSYISKNGGRSWRLLEQTSGGQRFLDPVCLFTMKTRLFAALGGGLTTERTASPLRRGMWIYRAAQMNLAANGTKISNTEGGFFDRPFLAIDRTGPRFLGRLYLAGAFAPVTPTRPEKPVGNRVGLWRSSDDGKSFEGPITADLDGDDFIPGSTAVTVQETVLMTFAVGRGAESQDGDGKKLSKYDLYVIASDNGGESFRPPVKVTSFEQDAYQDDVYYCGCLPQIVADTSTGPYRGRIYVAWTEFIGGSSKPVVAFSNDEGSSWSKPSIIPSSSERSGDGAQPTIAVNRDGLIGVTWQGELPRPALGYTERFSLSADGGFTFSPSVQVSESTHDVFRAGRDVLLNRMEVAYTTAAPSSFNLNLAESAWPPGGDTAGLDVDSEGRFHAAWIDNRTGTDQIWTSVITVVRTSESTSERQPAANEAPIYGVRTKNIPPVSREVIATPEKKRADRDIRDVTAMFQVSPEGGAFDSTSNILSVVVAATLRGKEAVRQPVRLQVIDAQSTQASEIEVLTRDVALGPVFAPAIVKRALLKFRLRNFAPPRTWEEKSSVVRLNLGLVADDSETVNSDVASPRFVLTFPSRFLHGSLVGRAYLVFSTRPSPEPRLLAGKLGNSVPFFGTDARVSVQNPRLQVGSDAKGYPIESIRSLPAGTYYVQAIFNVYTRYARSDGHTIWAHQDQGEGQQFAKSPGNMVSAPIRIKYSPQKRVTYTIPLSRILPQVSFPPDTRWVRHIRIPSPLLTKFWGVPQYLGAIVLLPKTYDETSAQLFPAVYHMNHFSLDPPLQFDEQAKPETPQQKHDREALGLRESRYDFTQRWMQGEIPQIVAVTFQHPTPYYDDSYAVDSANNGPYGEAIMTELIPYLEKHFRLIDSGHARFLYGGSTGGWEALALQIYHPNDFNGVWSLYPDPVDFHRFQLGDLYVDSNAFVKDYGAWNQAEIPTQRLADGFVVESMRGESRMELALGSRARSGEQFDAWNAAWGPIGIDGYPREFWNKSTGTIDHDSVEWSKDHGYDLAEYVRRNWNTIGTSLVGKIHIDVGDDDDFYLNLAVYNFHQLLNTLQPPPQAVVRYGRTAQNNPTSADYHGFQADPTAEYLHEMVERAHQ